MTPRCSRSSSPSPGLRRRTAPDGRGPSARPTRGFRRRRTSCLPANVRSPPPSTNQSGDSEAYGRLDADPRRERRSTSCSTPSAARPPTARGATRRRTASRHRRARAARAGPDHHIRPASAWGGSPSRGASRSRSALHLVGAYPVPVFLGGAWHAVDHAIADAQRRWFVASFARPPFPVARSALAMTRRMENLFLDRRPISA